jgi:hypothetical protein
MSSSPGQKSLIACIIITATLAAALIYNPRQRHDHFTKELAYDIYGYYIFLPLTFIYHDIGLKNFDEYKKNVYDKYKPAPTFYQVYRIENGNYTMNYTLGFAMLYAPFFFTAHIWASNSSIYPADGHSFPYSVCIGIGSFLFFVLPGIFILRKVLLRFFSDGIVATTLLLICLGTNYLCEAGLGYMGPHGMLFTGYALLLWLTIKWHERPSWKTAAGIGLLLGIMVLSRPSEILAVLIPVLWNVWNKQSFLAKWELVKRRTGDVIALMVAGFIVFIPQFIYWKVVTGSWIFFSYQNTEGFDLLHPHIIKCLFYFKKSWFVYTPLIVFPVVATFFMYRYNRKINLAVLVFFLLNFYLLSSWAAWWNGGSFGMRYYVESYAVMAIPFGYLLQRIALLNVFFRGVIGVVMTALSALNIFQIWQFSVAIIPGDRMTREYYKAIFLKTKITEEDVKLMEVERLYDDNELPFNPQEYNRRTLGYFNFETVNTSSLDSSRLDTTHAYSAPYSFRLDSTMVYSPGIEIPYEAITKKDHVYLRVTIRYFPLEDMAKNPVSIVTSLYHKSYANKYRARSLSQLPYKLNEWNVASIDYMTPFPHDESDKVKAYIWLQGNQPVYIDDVHIECFEKK